MDINKYVKRLSDETLKMYKTGAITLDTLNVPKWHRNLTNLRILIEIKTRGI